MTQEKQNALTDAYRRIQREELPEQIELTLIGTGGTRETLRYQKVRWHIQAADAAQGLRYGENPQQRAALYRLENDIVRFEDITIDNKALGQVVHGALLQSGKHPSKTNITDIDCGIQLLRYYMDRPTAIIIKHNNPCAVAHADTISEACVRAHRADSLAAFGGVVVLSRSVDVPTAEYIAKHYFELVAAPEYEAGSIAILQKRKNLRIFRIHNSDAIAEQRAMRLLHIQTLSDMSLCLQEQYQSPITDTTGFSAAMVVHNNKKYQPRFKMNEAQLKDALFGWHVVESLWSNAVCFVKDDCTVGIGCGAVDRVGAVKIAIDKAYQSHKEQFAQQQFHTSYHLLKDETRRRAADANALLHNGGLAGSVLCSDAFFPFSDSIQYAIRERVGAIVEPGGSINDWQVVEVCNNAKVPLAFTGKRAFRH